MLKTTIAAKTVKLSPTQLSRSKTLSHLLPSARIPLRQRPPTAVSTNNSVTSTKTVVSRQLSAANLDKKKIKKLESHGMLMWLIYLTICVGMLNLLWKVSDETKYVLMFMNVIVKRMNIYIFPLVWFSNHKEAITFNNNRIRRLFMKKNSINTV